MTAEPTLPDAEELTHLALAAAGRQQPARAISYLKLAIELSPDSAVAYYVLGALHAEMGLVDRAIREMGRAVELQPELHTARFQLGMLQLNLGRAEEARSTLAHLGSLPPDTPLARFRDGMLHMMEDRFDASFAEIEAGLALAGPDGALQATMRRVLDNARGLVAERDPGPSPPVAPSPSAFHVLLARYQSNAEGSEPEAS